MKASALARAQIPVARPSFGLDEESAVTEVLRSGWVSQGQQVANFEKLFASYVGARCAVAVSSCTTALHLALLAAGIKPGDDVLCPSLSFIATANAIKHAGATPFFVDIDIATYNIDPNCIEDAITPRTQAILVVHQIGLPCALDEISEIASRRGLVLLEDAACAVGAEYRGRRVGLPHSAAACFSFHPRKILTTGEGGMITLADEKLANRMRRLRQHAMSVSDLARHSSSQVVAEGYDEVGYNYRMTDIQAAIGLVQLQRLDGMLARRRSLASRYSQLLSQFDWMVLPIGPDECRQNFQSYMVRLRSDAPMTRDDLMQGLLDRGVCTRRGVMAIHREPPYRHAEWERRLPQTNLAADSTMILPLFDRMTEEQQDYVVECIRLVSASGTVTR